MASRWETIGDAVVTSLNAASLSQSFTSTRDYRPVVDLDVLEAATEVTVYVIPESRESETVSRVPIQRRDYTFAVEIYRYIADPTTKESVDTWTTFTEELEDHLMGAGTMGLGVWVGSDNAEPFDTEKLLDDNLFLSIVRVQYQVKQE